MKKEEPLPPPSQPKQKDRPHTLATALAGQIEEHVDKMLEKHVKNRAHSQITFARHCAICKQDSHSITQMSPHRFESIVQWLKNELTAHPDTMLTVHVELAQVQ